MQRDKKPYTEIVIISKKNKLIVICFIRKQGRKETRRTSLILDTMSCQLKCFDCVAESRSVILGPEYVKAGSTINFTCVINQVNMAGVYYDIKSI